MALIIGRIVGARLIAVPGVAVDLLHPVRGEQPDSIGRPHVDIGPAGPLRQRPRQHSSWQPRRRSHPEFWETITARFAAIAMAEPGEAHSCRPLTLVG